MKYNLDYTRIVDKTQKDLVTYQSKLDYVDNAINTKITGKLDFIYKIGHDKTMFLYALSHRDITTRWYQDQYLSDNHPYKIMIGANQVIGKSFTMNCDEAFNFLKDWGYGHNGAIISASKEQAKDQLRRVKLLLQKLKIGWEEHKEEDNVFSISRNLLDDKGNVKYQNRIIVAPYSVGSLGYDIHSLSLDEFDFWETDVKYVFNQFLQPRTYETMKLGRASIKICSNPNGDGSFMHKLSKQWLKNGKLKWHVYRFNYWDSPGANQEDFDMKCVGLTRRQIESTLLGIFSTGEKSYFSHEEIRDSYDAGLERNKHVIAIDKQTYWFLDVGATHDQAVLQGFFKEPNKDKPDLNDVFMFHQYIYPVGYPISRVVGSKSLIDDGDGWHYEKSVNEYLQEHKYGTGLASFGCDVTGNSGISPLFQSLGIVPDDVVFSGPNKSMMYQRYKVLMEQRRLHRIKSEEWESQARWIMAQKSQRGYLMIHNINHFQKKGIGAMKGVKSEQDLDDTQDCTAAGIQLCDPKDQVEPSLRFF